MQKKFKIKQITYVAIMIALSLVMNLIGKFLKFSFLSFDFSLIFIFLIYYYLGIKGLLVGILSRFLISCFFIAYEGIFSIIGQSILTLVHLIFCLTFHFLSYILINKKPKYWFWWLCLKLILTLIITTLLISTINTFFFNVVYFRIFETIQNLSLLELVNTYSSPNNEWLRLLFFGIKNYFLASYALYISFNLINLIVICLVIWQVLRVFNNSHLEIYLNIHNTKFTNQW
ncbi:hypothetical protein C4M97_00640 [Mycoplasmopsis pullorum]|uniref:MPN527 family putative ECF transporter permease subunit n=1 Tax=Mycoplasmopsis pullorum TaxID=48003 RepID=UPI0011183A84|nr:ECF transporter S component [Mycoplasmopsis pullorum]TNK82661.1 hypothetical protein C4M94_00090 [Mycoplasmopsis pullorum]TNK83455.1 hypothetical protein C4M80_00285 [Mycoplasmopsis pullorum]TNK85179.1 hypothetical protein C4M81_00190 [Mycoplasmopsis pullorum]TNK85680.1 hypothetical protein C4M92_00535 [Mycoplasmopsis pullorum]TNK86115.1 hypothetical protein C4M85_01255 [Mycoplasmopsis pullorum]